MKNIANKRALAVTVALIGGMLLAVVNSLELPYVMVAANL